MNVKLKDMRRMHGLTQKQISEKLGISQSSIVQWEYGHRIPVIQHIQQLCQMFHCQPEEIGYNFLAQLELTDDTSWGQCQSVAQPIPNAALMNARQQAGYTQWEVAQQVGVSATMIGVWESGKNLPSLPHLRLLCQFFQCPPEDLGYPIYPRYTVRLDDVYLQYTTSDKISCQIIHLSDQML
ncbi:helix-turn-helix transcriptional regulator [Dictyobacter arantiisoli]|uniref:HTH cro/C1-type domain-containing protein n=1 Tax=Dictyobacter arantiisoli TaxID=2014874 RepID=A0A5A5THB5_9CHLR|nr:helix-turn-helix transcriptional regulator [Dictyobacter arantiisoli]GCF10536.1 hypothetical protein KDI_41000 [Dictyobacter arantiisoli]